MLERSRYRLGYVLLAIPLVFAAVVIVPPLLFNLYASTLDWRLAGGGEPRFIGLDNYITVFTDARWLETVGRTLVYVVATVGLELVIGFTVALLLYRQFNNLRWLQAIFLLPLMISEVAAALSWKYLVSTDGSLLNWFIGVFGISPQAWLGPTWAFPTVIVVDVWQHTPFVILVMFAAMQGLPKELLEAASVDGASVLSQVRNIVLPMLAPAILVVLVFRTVFALRAFTSVWLLTGGGPANSTALLGIEIYKVGFYSFETSFGATLGVILLVLSVVAGVAYMKLLSRESLS